MERSRSSNRQGSRPTVASLEAPLPPALSKVKVEDGDQGEATGQTIVIIGAAVDLSILPATSNSEVGAQLQLRLHVKADSPVDTVQAVIKFGWRMKFDSHTTSFSNKFSSVFCSPVGSGDGTITCTATNSTPISGDFDVRLFNFTAVSIGPADVKFDAATDATLGAGSVLSKTLDAAVKVQGNVDVAMNIALEAVPAAGRQRQVRSKAVLKQRFQTLPSGIRPGLYSAYHPTP